MMPDRISAWLENLGLGIYREAFQRNAITWEVLPELNPGDLESLGILLGHRKILLRAIAQLSVDVLGRGNCSSDNPTNQSMRQNSVCVMP
jgi:SAM domain (Sterile alpha motif)